MKEFEGVIDNYWLDCDIKIYDGLEFQRIRIDDLVDEIKRSISKDSIAIERIKLIYMDSSKDEIERDIEVYEILEELK